MKYKFWATRCYSVMFGQAFCEYAIENGCHEMNVVPIGGKKADYIPSISFEDACINVGKHFLRNARKLLKEYGTRANTIIDYAKKLSEKAGIISDEKLLEIYKQYLIAANAFQPYIMFPHYSELVLEPKLQSHKHFDKITALWKPLIYMKMQRDLFIKSPEEVAKEYGWMAVYGMNEEPFDKDYYIKYKKKLNEKTVLENIEELKKNKEEYDKLSIIDLEIQTLHNFVFIRTDRMDMWKKHAYLLYPFADYLGKKVYSSFNHIQGSMLSKEEIISILSGNMPVSIDDLKLRGTRNDIMITYANKVTFTKDKNKIKSVLNSIKILVKDKIKGLPVHKGIVRGIVKLYLNKEDISVEEKDYILISRYTSPQDIINMKKAKGIVTDEGGITCHAAIVSRELGIPCIVGTKIATKVFKDGDYVEVDADKGVVRKI